MIFGHFGESAGASRSRVHFVFVVLLFVVAVAWILAHKLIEAGFENGLNTSDGGVFATIGAGILHGQLPYSNFWDHKLPGIYFVDALIFLILPTNPWSLHVAEAAEAILATIIFFWAVRPIATPLAAAASAAVFAYVSTLPALNQMGNLTETYWQLPMVAALGMMIRILTGERSGRLLVAAGAASGAATLFAPQALVPLIIFTGFVVFLERRRRNVVFGRLLLLLGSTVGVVAPVLVWLATSAGPSRFWEQIWTYNRAYASAVPDSALGSFLLANGEMWLSAIIICCLLIAGAVVLARLDNPLVPIFLLLSLLGAFATALADRHFYPHDLLLVVPAACVLLAYEVGQIAIALARSPRSSTTALLVPVIAGVAIVCQSAGHDASAAIRDAGRLRLSAQSPSISRSPALLARQAYPLVSIPGVNLFMKPVPATGHQLAAEAIDRLTARHAFIYMYGPEGGMYFVSNRRPASRFLFNSPLIGSFGSAVSESYNWSADRSELLSDLQRHPPALIAVRAFYRSPASVGRFPAFERLLCEKYHVRAYIQGFLMYLSGAGKSTTKACFARFGSPA